MYTRPVLTEAAHPTATACCSGLPHPTALVKDPVGEFQRWWECPKLSMPDDCC